MGIDTGGKPTLHEFAETGFRLGAVFRHSVLDTIQSPVKVIPDFGCTKPLLAGLLEGGCPYVEESRLDLRWRNLTPAFLPILSLFCTKRAVRTCNCPDGFDEVESDPFAFVLCLGGFFCSEVISEESGTDGKLQIRFLLKEQV